MFALYFVLLFSFSYSQNEVNPIGSYILNPKNSNSAIMELIIKKKGYTMNADDRFKGEYFEYGDWSMAHDTLILNCKTRKNKYDKNSSYSDKNEKKGFKYEKTERYLILKDQLCSLQTSNRGKGFCFIKK